MSTLVVLGVVLLAIAGVLHLVLDQPDQPPTIRLISGRVSSRRGRGLDAAGPAVTGAGEPVVVVADGVGQHASAVAYSIKPAASEPAASYPAASEPAGAVSVAVAELPGAGVPVADLYPADLYPAPLPVMVVEVSTTEATRVRSAVTLMMLVAAMGVAVALLVVAVVLSAVAVVTGGAA